MRNYEFDVQVWFDEELDTWCYSIVQDVDGDIMPLFYGTADNESDSLEAVSDFLREHFVGA